MIYVGVDDTDVLGSPGTNKFARALALRLADRYQCKLIVRHQLLQDPRVPCTSKNSAASMLLQPQNGSTINALTGELRAFVREWFVEGSDPGFCVTANVPGAVVAFGKQCQRELVTQGDARRLAEEHEVYLEGCGGTNDGVIGALAAVGLAAEGNDGRVVQIGEWPDDLTGPQKIAAVRARNVEVQCLDTGTTLSSGTVDVGKHLRPSYRQGKIVLFAQPVAGQSDQANCWKAIRFT